MNSVEVEADHSFDLNCHSRNWTDGEDELLVVGLWEDGLWGNWVWEDGLWGGLWQDESSLPRSRSSSVTPSFRLTTL